MSTVHSQYSIITFSTDVNIDLPLTDVMGFPDDGVIIDFTGGRKNHMAAITSCMDNLDF